MSIVGCDYHPTLSTNCFCRYRNRPRGSRTWRNRSCISHVYPRANQRSPRATRKRQDVSGYVRALKALGVERCDSYLADGHSVYFSQTGESVVSPPVHEALTVAETSQRETFLKHLSRHEQRQTSYLEMSIGLAKSGIEKWTIDTSRMTMTFHDKSGREMFVERIG